VGRKRWIKPEASLDEDLAQLSFEARLCFLMLPCHADREGRLEDRPMKISALIFPYDSVDMEGILEQLAMPRQYAGSSFITRYETKDGRKYIQINNFVKHQTPHPNEQQSEIAGPTAEVVKCNYISGQEIKKTPSSSSLESRTRSRASTKPGASKKRRASTASQSRQKFKWEDGIAWNKETREIEMSKEAREGLSKHLSELAEREKLPPLTAREKQSAWGRLNGHLIGNPFKTNGKTLPSIVVNWFENDLRNIRRMRSPPKSKQAEDVFDEAVRKAEEEARLEE
jgi:hypothetical protein